MVESTNQTINKVDWNQIYFIEKQLDILAIQLKAFTNLLAKISEASKCKP
jgi:hypothetical protein